jgi:hypothetical protein
MVTVLRFVATAAWGTSTTVLILAQLTHAINFAAHRPA